MCVSVRRTPVELCMCPTLHSVYVVMCVSRRRQEREKLAVAGVPEVWGLSPPPPELDSDDDEVVKRREEARLMAELVKPSDSNSDSDEGEKKRKRRKHQKKGKKSKDKHKKR